MKKAVMNRRLFTHLDMTTLPSTGTKATGLTTVFTAQTECLSTHMAYSETAIDLSS